jgi:hypothetical protein
MIAALFRELGNAAHGSLRRVCCVFSTQALSAIFSGQFVEMEL